MITSGMTLRGSCIALWSSFHASSTGSLETRLICGTPLWYMEVQTTPPEDGRWER